MAGHILPELAIDIDHRDGAGFIVKVFDDLRPTGKAATLTSGSDLLEAVGAAMVQYIERREGKPIYQPAPDPDQFFTWIAGQMMKFERVVYEAGGDLEAVEGAYARLVDILQDRIDRGRW